MELYSLPCLFTAIIFFRQGEKKNETVALALANTVTFCSPVKLFSPARLP